MLKLGDLALRPDMQLGPMLVSPSRRLVEGPGGHAHLEPLIMQVFLLLLDAGGKVVTRTELFDRCWGGVIVGDDSLNRAVAKLRRTGAQVAPGLVEIETIPRTGYRLTGDILRHIDQARQSAPSGAAPRPMSRRGLLAGGAATAAALAGAGAFWVTQVSSDPRFDTLMARGREALRYGQSGGADYFQQAVAIEPENAQAWGLLAYALAAGPDDTPGEVSGAAAQSVERAARTALNIDGDEPNALLALATLESQMLDWAAREHRYRQVLAIDGANTLAMRHLGQMLHGVGRCREAFLINERAVAVEPLAAAHQFQRAMRLWVLGRTADADRVADRAMELWPSHRLVRMARLMIYAFTGRAEAALALVEDEKTSPHLLSPNAASLWRVSLTALAKPTPSSVAAARTANIEGSKSSAASAAWAILVLSALGELDAAFEIADGFLLGRGSVIVRPHPTTKGPILDRPGWRNTYGLFTPPTRAMRLDPRFDPLAKGLGLTEYWRRRGIGPDAFLFDT